MAMQRGVDGPAQTCWRVTVWDCQHLGAVTCRIRWKTVISRQSCDTSGRQQQDQHLLRSRRSSDRWVAVWCQRRFAWDANFSQSWLGHTSTDSWFQLLGPGLKFNTASSSETTQNTAVSMEMSCNDAVWLNIQFEAMLNFWYILCACSCCFCQTDADWVSAGCHLVCGPGLLVLIRFLSFLCGRVMFLTWFRSCLMECCRVRMWLNSGLCRVSLRFPTVSPWVHSSLWTSLACSRSRAPSTCWRSAEDTEDKHRMSRGNRNKDTCEHLWLQQWIYLLGHFQTWLPSLSVCCSGLIC